MTRILLNGAGNSDFGGEASHSQLTKAVFGRVVEAATITYKTNHGGGELKPHAVLKLEANMVVNVARTGAA